MEEESVALGGRRTNKKKKKKEVTRDLMNDNYKARRLQKNTTRQRERHIYARDTNRRQKQ